MILCLCPNPSVDKFVWLDDFIHGKVNKIKKELAFPGGKGVHVALGLAELGEPCVLLGFWGGDTGKYIKEFCESKGVYCYGPAIDSPNRTCFTFRSKTDLNDTELVECGPFITDDQVYLFWLEFIRLLDKATAVCLSGSWPITPDEIGYPEFIVAAKKKGIKTFVDCSEKYLSAAVKVNPYCIHINNDEGAKVFHENSPLKIASKALEKCELVAVTSGADGLHLANKNHYYIHATCRLSNVISAVGSGDALMAGLIAADRRSYDLFETAKLAVACGAANCIREELGFFYQEDVETLFSEIELATIESRFINQEP